MHSTTEQQLQRLIETGIARPAAEVLIHMIDAYGTDPFGFDEDYWVWRLERAGIEEKKAHGYIKLLRNPSLAMHAFRKK